MNQLRRWWHCRVGYQSCVYIIHVHIYCNRVPFERDRDRVLKHRDKYEKVWDKCLGLLLGVKGHGHTSQANLPAKTNTARRGSSGFLAFCCFTFKCFCFCCFIFITFVLVVVVFPVPVAEVFVLFPLPAPLVSLSPPDRPALFLADWVTAVRALVILDLSARTAAELDPPAVGGDDMVMVFVCRVVCE